MTGRLMTGGQALASQLLEEGVRDVFCVPGFQLDWATDALHEHAERIRMIVPRHEQAVSYMADGYARATGRPGVCMAVPGPGVLNAMSGLATAYACSSPVLMIAGQIPSHCIGREWGQLHEIRGQSAILASVSKFARLARRPEEVPEIVHEAFAQMNTDRPRPAIVEIPPDVLQARGPAGIIAGGTRRIRSAPEAGVVGACAALLDGAAYPVIYAGGGVLASDACEALRGLAQALQAPVVMSESGRGALSDSHPLALNALGGRVMLAHADVVLVVGSRFLDAVASPPPTRADASRIYINTDARDAGAPRPDGTLLHADALAALDALAQAITGRARASRAADVARVRAWCERQQVAIQPQHAWANALRLGLPEDGILVSELTQVGYFASLGFPVYRPRSFLTPGYQGTLGYGFPTALGAALGSPGRAVVSITGDGGFGWCLQELATAARYSIGVVTVVFRDEAFGNVRRIQNRVFGRSTGTDLHNPDFLKLAGAFGVEALRVDTPEALERELRGRLPVRRPLLIDVPVGEMASPWHLIHRFSPPPSPAPEMPVPGA